MLGVRFTHCVASLTAQQSVYRVEQVVEAAILVTRLILKSLIPLDFCLHFGMPPDGFIVEKLLGCFINVAAHVVDDMIPIILELL